MKEENFALVADVKAAAIIETNVSNLKAWVEKAVEPYRGMRIEESQVKDAKASLAMLRKLKTACEDERKAIKEKVNKPYEDFNELYKDAMGSLDTVISDLSGQISAFEEEDARKRIESRWNEFLKIAEDIGKENLKAFVFLDKVKAWAWDHSWELKGTTDTRFKEQAGERIKSIWQNIELISRNADKDLLLPEYIATGSLTASLLEVQKKKESMAIAAKIADEERARKEAEAKASAGINTEEPRQEYPSSESNTNTECGKSIHITELEVTMSINRGERVYSLDDESYPDQDRKQLSILRKISGPKYKLGLGLSLLKILGLTVEKTN